jgi:UPF0755 protein
VKRIAAWLLIVIIVALAAGAGWLWLGSREAYKGYQDAELFVDIPQGSGPASIGRRLVQSGVVRDELLFRFEIWRSGSGRRLQAGEYRFDRPLTVADVVAKLARGDVYLRPITFPEGLTIRQMSVLFESKGFGTVAEFAAAARDTQLLTSIDPDARNLEGYLFPDTYALPRAVSAGQLASKMVGEFQKALTPEIRQQASARGLSVRELVTLASLVEKETGTGDERPIVAAVYLNRLRIGMRLQCDPTVLYALELAGNFSGNIRRDDLMIDSPYNTYRYSGLPPGPIASPGRASLQAVAAPASVPYLYFVSRNDGSHVFAETLAEHNRNVNEFQKRPRRRP